MFRDSVVRIMRAQISEICTHMVEFIIAGIFLLKSSLY